MGQQNIGNQKMVKGNHGLDAVCKNAFHSPVLNFPCNVSSENIFGSKIPGDNTVPSTPLFTRAPYLLSGTQTGLIIRTGIDITGDSKITREIFFTGYHKKLLSVF